MFTFISTKLHPQLSEKFLHGLDLKTNMTYKIIYIETTTNVIPYQTNMRNYFAFLLLSVCDGNRQVHYYQSSAFFFISLQTRHQLSQATTLKSRCLYYLWWRSLLWAATQCFRSQYNVSFGFWNQQIAYCKPGKIPVEVTSKTAPTRFSKIYLSQIITDKMVN